MAFPPEAAQVHDFAVLDDSGEWAMRIISEPTMGRTAQQNVGDLVQWNLSHPAQPLPQVAPGGARMLARTPTASAALFAAHPSGRIDASGVAVPVGGGAGMGHLGGPPPAAVPPPGGGMFPPQMGMAQQQPSFGGMPAAGMPPVMPPGYGGVPYGGPAPGQPPVIMGTAVPMGQPP